MASPILKYFVYAPVPEQLQSIRRQMYDLALSIDTHLPDGDQKSAGLRKLLEAKDCFVRAELG